MRLSKCIKANWRNFACSNHKQSIQNDRWSPPLFIWIRRALRASVRWLLSSRQLFFRHDVVCTRLETSSKSASVQWLFGQFQLLSNLSWAPFFTWSLCESAHDIKQKYEAPKCYASDSSVRDNQSNAKESPDTYNKRRAANRDPKFRPCKYAKKIFQVLKHGRAPSALVQSSDEIQCKVVFIDKLWCLHRWGWGISVVPISVLTVYGEVIKSFGIDPCKTRIIEAKMCWGNASLLWCLTRKLEVLIVELKITFTYQCGRSELMLVGGPLRIGKDHLLPLDRS